MRVLAVMGLIETRPGRGAHVLRKVEGIYRPQVHPGRLRRISNALRCRICSKCVN